MKAVMKRSSASVAASWLFTCRNAVSRSAPRRNAMRSIACICVTESAGAMPWPGRIAENGQQSLVDAARGRTCRRR